MDTDPQVQGILNESRFFAIIEDVIGEGRAPQWLYSIRRANQDEDNAGVDGFVKIRQRYNPEALLVVPFQLKSSYSGVLEHLKQNRLFWLDALRYFIINPDMNDDRIARVFFNELETIHKNRERFDRLMNHLEGYSRSQYRKGKRNESRQRSRRPAKSSVSDSHQKDARSNGR